MAITTRQQLFIGEYLSDPKRNSAAAARRAGYSAKRASATAAEILADKEIQEEIKRQLAGQLHKLHIDADMVIAGILATLRTPRSPAPVPGRPPDGFSLGREGVRF